MYCKDKIYYNLTHAQKRVWYIEKIYSNSPLHNIGGCLKIKGDIDFKILEKSINIIIKKNDAFRLNFIEKDGQAYQYVNDFKYEEIDFWDFSVYENPKDQFHKWCKDNFTKSFLLEQDKLYYFGMYKISNEDCGLLVNIHHIISDGWSISIIQKQICELYNSLTTVQKETEVNCDVEYSYVDYIEKEKKYLESDKFIKNKMFWNDKFSNLSEIYLYKGSDKLDGKRKSFNIEKEFSKKIRFFVKEQGTSLNTFFISVLLVYLNKVTGHKDSTIGTPVLNRSGKKEKSTIGMFTSTMPFRFKMNTEISMQDLIKQITSELKYCFFNQRYPYDLLVKDLELSKRGYDSLFHICVNYYNSTYENYVGNIPVVVEDYYSGNQNYSLQIIVKEWDEDDSITLCFDYKTTDYSVQAIEEMYKYIISISKQILDDVNKTIINLSLISEEEKSYKIYELNCTKSDYPKDKTIYELFEEQVKKTPNNIALSFQNKNLTYRELNEKSNALAAYLREIGVTKESIVGIMATHSFEIVIGILAVLKAGGAYLPIDVDYPIERINYMLEDSNAKVVLTNIETSSEIKFNNSVEGKILDLNCKEIYLDNKENLKKTSDIGNLAYIIYTSGSTGKPKGVMIEHKGLVNYICWAKKEYLKKDDDVFAFYSSISFDLTVTSIFTPLISGNTMAIYSDDGEEFILYKILKDNKATVVKLTPSHLALIKDNDNTHLSIRRFVVGGENLKVSTAKEVYESFGGNVEIFNEYGPTETVVGCMIYKYNILKDNGVSVPIGIPSNNVQIYILDKYLNVVPTGIEGEIYISGDGVARGYLNREELTEEKFIDNPFISASKMYKSGDTGKYLEDGNIEYVGRNDNQVKIRGHRIELGEIEKYLLQNEQIKNVLVIDRNTIKGDKVLYAYLVSEEAIQISELKKWLSKFVPQYMIPTHFINLKSLPLTLNGKVNLDLLPLEDKDEKNFVEGRNYIEKSLIEAMQQVLGVNDISINDNFYYLGGDSIKAIQISSKLNNIGLNVKVKEILSHDTIEEIAACVEISSKKIEISQENIIGTIKNTPIIEWFFQQKFHDDYHFNQSVLLKCKEKLNLDNINDAYHKLIEHHDILRINYDKTTKELYYNNEYLNKTLDINYYDLSNDKNDVQIQKIKEVGNLEKGSFHLEKNILFKICVFDLGKDSQAILFTAHHLIVDGVSWRILLDDFSHIVKILKNKEEISLPKKTHSFMEWALRLHEYSNSGIEAEKGYWQNILNKNYYYKSDFDSDKDDMKFSTVISSEIDKKTIDDFYQKVNETYGMELNEALIVALALTITNINKRSDVVIEIERHGRESISDDIDLSRTVGWFTSMYPLYLELNQKDLELNEGALDSNIKALKEQIRNTPNKGFNYSILQYINNVLYTEKAENKYIRFNYLGDFDNLLNNEEFNIWNIDCGADVGGNNQLTALMDITAMHVNNNFKVEILYSNNRFKEETVQNFINEYVKQIYYLLDFCKNKNSKEFTPSDFDTVDISQEDLDMLFD